jgi:hypothetical protein
MNGLSDSTVIEVVPHRRPQTDGGAISNTGGRLK